MKVRIRHIKNSHVPQGIAGLFFNLNLRTASWGFSIDGANLGELL